MANNKRLDEIRSNVLKNIERNERNFKLVLLVAAIWELMLLVALLVGMERGNRTHLLLLIATVGSYTLVVIGLFALGVHLNGGNLRVLKALELLKDTLTANK